MTYIPFFKPELGQDEVSAASCVLLSRHLTQGPDIQYFESEFATFQGAKHCVAVNAGTSALYLALLALGIGPGDEVITTPISWVATALAIRWTGATVVFADVEPATGLLDPESALELVTPRTRAIVPVHLYGSPVDIAAFLTFRDSGIKIVWDCAHAIETEYDDHRAGSFPDVACYSFFGSKNLTTAGEGGAVVTDNPEIDRYVRRARLFGLEMPSKECVQFGAKFNLTDVQAAVGRVQLASIWKRWEARAVRRRRYQEGLYPGQIWMEKRWRGERRAHHLMAIQAANPVRVAFFLDRTEEGGMGWGKHYRTITSHPQFRDTARPATPRADDFGAHTISLPFYPTMPLEDVDRVCARVHESGGL